MLTQAASLDDTKPLQKLSYLRLDISVVFRYVIYTYWASFFATVSSGAVTNAMECIPAVEFAADDMARKIVFNIVFPRRFDIQKAAITTSI